MAKKSWLKVYKSYISVLFKGQLNNKWSSVFVGMSIGLVSLTSLLAVLMLFSRFGSIGGYTLFEVLLCYAIVGLGFRGSEILFRGFDVFSRSIRQGSFDRIMLRPRGLFFQVICTEFPIQRFSSLLQNLIIFIFVVIKIDIVWSFTKAVVLP